MLTSEIYQPDQTITCAECGMETRHDKRQDHVFFCHLKERRLFECPFCDFALPAFSTVVHRHIIKIHGDDTTRPRSRISELSEKIAEWNMKCFKWTNEHLQSTNTDLTTCHNCEKEVVNPYRHIAEVHMKINLHECPHCSYGSYGGRAVKNHISRYHPDDLNCKPLDNLVVHREEFTAIHNECFPRRRGNKIAPNKCTACGKIFRRRERLDHVLKKHILKPIYQCSRCPFFSSYDKKRVIIHGKEQHDGKAVALNNMESMKEIIERVCTECFPDWTEIDKEIKQLQ
ncbi:hypothetical protein PRIPAC_97058 [Pristionchus pacificus]|uniref:Uncharacterized protein n=1 Tax=Pristionchus pacificus TaxID=54126 RepID=A0A2A6BK26_PRIPA|nr:hypothetical protein PRIPAC_97058 [Pristionchus pacificus]|eukprot:PDM66188.1 hypothetical protein PRIPAC_45413 [Pristionchus pacificus]